MAQAGFTPIQLFSTSTAAAVPTAASLTNSTLGSELAINITDGKLFYKDNANAVQVIGWKTVPTTAGGTGLTSYTAGDTLFYASGTTLSKLAIGTAGQILTSTGTAPQWTTLTGVAVTTFSAGTTGFTPNSATSGAITLAGTLITSNGGTGLSSYTAGDLSYYASGTALTKLAIGASGRFLSSTGSAPQWSAPAALTEIDDTNVTMTLGGNPSTALLSAVSMTLGWTGQLATSRGGTGLSSFTSTGIVYASSTSALATSSNLVYSTNLTINEGNLRSVRTSGAPTVFLQSNQAAGGSTPTAQFYRTGASNTATPNSQNIGSVRFDGLDASGSFTNFALINAEIGTNAAGGAPTTLTFHTAASGASAAERIRLFPTGGVSIGNTTDPGVGALRVTNDVTSVSGNFVVGTSGKGIDFSATPGTGTSELFADYEEGTWTPVDGSGASLSFTSASGVYTKVGRQVTVFFTLVYPITANANAARIGGLPFTAANSSNGFNSGAFNVNNSGQVVQPSIVANDVLFAALLTATGTSATNAQLTGASLRGGFSYFV